jgi:hypothetical protein
VKDLHVADWKVKGTGFPNLSNSRYAKSRNYLSLQIEVCSGPLIHLHLGVSPIVTWNDENLYLRNSEMRDGKKIRTIGSPRMWTIDLSSISELHLSQLGVNRTSITGIARCELTIRSGPSIHQDSGPLIQLHFGVSRIATWRGKKHNHRSSEMPKREIVKYFKACGLSRWSHHRRAEEKSTCRQAPFRRFGDRDLESRETSQRN